MVYYSSGYIVESETHSLGLSSGKLDGQNVTLEYVLQVQCENAYPPPGGVSPEHLGGYVPSSQLVLQYVVNLFTAAAALALPEDYLVSFRVHYVGDYAEELVPEAVHGLYMKLFYVRGLLKLKLFPVALDIFLILAVLKRK